MSRKDFCIFFFFFNDSLLNQCWLINSHRIKSYTKMRHGMLNLSGVAPVEVVIFFSLSLARANESGCPCRFSTGSNIDNFQVRKKLRKNLEYSFTKDEDWHKAIRKVCLPKSFSSKNIMFARESHSGVY